MTQLRVWQGDITTLSVGAIVNAANSALVGGSGVDGAIQAAGGPEILREGRQWVATHGPLPTGEAVTTTGGDLPVSGVIHTVGPIWRRHPPEDADRLLRSCYRNSLDAARDIPVRSVAFPAISTGVYGFPPDRAAPLAIAAVKEWSHANPDAMDEIVFCCFDAESARRHTEALAKH